MQKMANPCTILPDPIKSKIRHILSRFLPVESTEKKTSKPIICFSEMFDILKTDVSDHPTKITGSRYTFRNTHT